MNAALYAAALSFAIGVKLFYAGAGADSLRFVLAPTAALVGALSGHPFEAEAGVGYSSRELRFVIAPVCAGLNYFVISFCTLVLGFTARIERPARRLAWLPAAAVIAFAATLLANAARIALAIRLREAPFAAGLPAGELHRALGVVVYLCALWLLVAAIERFVTGRTGLARTGWLALAIYGVVTLGLPVLNGAYERPGFRLHAATVSAVSLGLAALAALGRIRATVPRRWTWSCRRSSGS